MWNWASGQRICSARVGSIKINSLSFDGTGGFNFVTAGQRHLKFWTLSEKGSLEGRFGILGDHKNSSFADVSCEENETYAITEKGILAFFGSGRVLEKWVDLKVHGGFSIATTERMVVCGCSDGIVRVFERGTLGYMATLPRPHQLGIDIAAPENSSNALYADVVAVRVKDDKVAAVYSDHSLFLWDVADFSHVGKYRSLLFHSDCVWGVERSTLNTFITYASDGTARFWNLDSNEPKNIYSKDLFKILYIDPASLLSCKLLSNDPEPPVRAGVRSLKVSLDGKWMASGDRLGNVKHVPF